MSERGLRIEDATADALVARIGTAPEVWLGRLAWAVIGVCCVQIAMFGYGRDQGIYAVVADSILHGGMPYRDAWDFKPPAIFLMFAVAQVWLGKAMISIRLFEIAGLVGAVFAFRRIATLSFGAPLVGLVGGALAVLMHTELEFWHTAQPESFGGMATIYAVACVVGDGAGADDRRKRMRSWAIAGALFGVAFLFKPPLGGAALPCALYLGITEWRRRQSPLSPILPPLVLGAASLLPIALSALWFVWRGAWPALSWTLFEFTPGYTRLGWQLPMSDLVTYAITEVMTRFSYVMPAGLLLAFVLPTLHRRERGVVGLVLGIVGIELVGVALQAKFFQYHYSATLPFLAFLGGLGLVKLYRYVWSRTTLIGALGTVALAGVLVVLVEAKVAMPAAPGSFWERCVLRTEFLLFRTTTREALDGRLYAAADYSLGADQSAVSVVTRLTQPGDSIYVWGFEPFLYWSSGRRPASRYLYNVPQRAAWQRERARNELMADLTKDPPTLLVIQHGDFFRFVTGDDLDSAGALATFPRLQALIDSQYAWAATVEDFVVLQHY